MAYTEFQLPNEGFYIQHKILPFRRPAVCWMTNSRPAWQSKPGPSPLPTPLCPAIPTPPPTPPTSKSSPSVPTTRSPPASSGSCQSLLNSPVGTKAPRRWCRCWLDSKSTANVCVLPPQGRARPLPPVPQRAPRTTQRRTSSVCRSLQTAVPPSHQPARACLQERIHP